MGFSYLKSNPIFDDSVTLYAVYNNVGGLQPGTPVTINGYNVGKVNDIQFNDTKGNLLVTFTVDSDFEFSKNSRAELYDTGIIGGKGIQIIPTFDNAPMAQKNDTLKTHSKPGLTELLQEKLTPLQMKIEGAFTNADSLLTNVNEVLDDKAKKDLRETIASLSVVMKSLEGTATALNGLMATNRTKLDSTITNLKTITDNFSQISDSLSNAGLASTMRSLQSTVKNLDLVMAKVEEGEGTLGKLMEDEALYTNLANASRELDLLLQDFRLNPKRYVNVSVFGKKQKDYELPENDPAEQINSN